MAWEIDPSREGSLIEVSFPYFRDWRAQSRSFEELAAYGSVNWSHEFKGPPSRETVSASFVSASFFDTLRARPLLGRTFLPHEDESAAGRVLVLSHGLWQRRFAGDPRVVGSKVAGGDELFTIVGVMPREFDFPKAPSCGRRSGRRSTPIAGATTGRPPSSGASACCTSSGG